MAEIGGDASPVFAPRNKRKSKKVWLIFGAGVAFVAFAAWYVVNHVTVVRIGSDAQYTISDVEQVYAIEKEIGQLLGTSSVNERLDVIYTFVVASLQQEVLKRNNVNIEENNATRLVENRALLKGLYRDIKERLQDRYFPLFIKPVIVGNVFTEFYAQNNASRRLAIQLLNRATEVGLDASVANTGLTVNDLKLQVTEQNRDLINKIQQDKSQGVYKQIIEYGNQYLVAEPQSLDDESLTMRGVLIPQGSAADLVRSAFEQIEVWFHPLYWHSVSDLKQMAGSVFAEKGSNNNEG